MRFSKKTFLIAAATPIALIGVMACAHMAMMKDVQRPAVSEFGYGPRTSINGSFRATIEENRPYETGKLLSSVINVQDAKGGVVDNAQITVDGGMPQHGHGLPTRPRVTKDLGNGRYQVDGLKFNMGGWWELRFAITAGTTSDTVTFNLDL